MDWNLIRHRIRYNRQSKITVSAIGFTLIVILGNIIYGLGQLSGENQKLKDDYSLVVNKLSSLEKKIEAANNLSKDIWSLSRTNNNQVTDNLSFQNSIIGPQFQSTIIGRSDYIEKNTESLVNTLSVISKYLSRKEDVLKHIPSQLPSAGLISSRFGYRKSPFSKKRTLHKGIDIAAKRGTPVYAAAQGVVRFSGFVQSYGNYVEIDHGNGFMTRYAHNSKLVVERGQIVKQGQLISKVGSTGRSTGPHLHFEVWLKRTAVNPEQYFYDKPEYSKKLILAEGFYGQAKKSNLDDDDEIISIGGEL